MIALARPARGASPAPPRWAEGDHAVYHWPGDLWDGCPAVVHGQAGRKVACRVFAESGVYFVVVHASKLMRPDEYELLCDLSD